MERAHQNVTGSALQDYVLPAYLDARVYALYGEMAALTYGPYAENIHGFDERFSLASLQRSTAVLALFIAEWCGLSPSKTSRKTIDGGNVHPCRVLSFIGRAGLDHRDRDTGNLHYPRSTEFHWGGTLNG